MRDRVAPDGKAAGTAPRRRPYGTPRLERLGTLTELTAAVGRTSNKNDHGPPGGPRKTS